MLFKFFDDRAHNFLCTFCCIGATGLGLAMHDCASFEFDSVSFVNLDMTDCLLMQAHHIIAAR